MSLLSGPAEEFSGNSRFELVRSIGAGGIGLVYEAIDRAYDVRVALKTLQQLSSDGLLRFKNEFRLLQGIHHHNLIRLGELFEDSGNWFFTMELIDGVDFLTYVVESKPRRPLGSAPSVVNTEVMHTGLFQSASIFAQEADCAVVKHRAHYFDEAHLREGLRQLAAGLNALHRAGMVHRDIKPQNVMVSHGRVVLLDFGLVSEKRPWHQYHADRGLVMGTPLYMAPEQGMGKPATPASDWYAVGTMLYEALTGTRPFQGPPDRVLRSKIRRDPEPPSERRGDFDKDTVPKDLEALCIQLLQRDPEDRPTGPKVLALLSGRSTDAMAVAAMAEPGVDIDLPLDLVGRTEEMAALGAALHKSSPGRPVMAFVHGTSGMGKSALVTHFAREARDEDGALVLRGRCYEREAVPYKAFDGVVDALSHYLAELLGAAKTLSKSTRRTPRRRPSIGVIERFDPVLHGGIRDLIAREYRVLARLFPVLGIVLAPERSQNADDATELRNPEELRRQAFVALKRLFALIAARRPLVLVIDDLQWGDLDSAALLTELISPPDAPGFLLIATYRSEEAESPLVTSLRSGAYRSLESHRVREVEVGPLSESDCHSLAMDIWRHIESRRPRHNILSERRASSLARAATRESGGSPFFVSEMMRYLALSASLDTDESAGAIEMGHVTLEQVLIERRQQLDPIARSLLDVVAVAGRPIAQGVALRAAGLDGSEMWALAALRAAHFVRTRGPGIKDVVEIYHERIAEAVHDQLGDSAVRGHHAWLAMALEDWGSDDAEMLAEHHYGAGRIDRAVVYALQAAEHAEHALAFDRAARMYRLVLDMPLEDHVAPGTIPDRHQLFIRLGEALSNAGRGADAAAAYLAAAESGAVDSAATSAPANAPANAPAAQQSNTALVAANGFDMLLECKRRAAEQFLRSGNIEQGVALLREVLAACNLRVPRTSKRALWSLIVRRLQLRVRGLHYQAKPPEQISARDRQRADACWSGAIGLTVIDQLLSADFATRCLLMALEHGDETRIARTLALDAYTLVARGVKGSARAVELCRVAAAIARRNGEPLTIGFTTFAPAAIALFGGRWRRARELIEQAEESIRGQCTGTTWEVATARLHLGVALYYLGEWGLLRHQCGTLVRQALDRGDRYTAGILASHAAYGDLAADDVAGARQTMDQAAVSWATNRYHGQQYAQLVGNVQIDLYVGDPFAAWARLSSELRAFRYSFLMQIQLTRVEISYLRARCALALIAAGAPNAKQFLRIASRQARRMERERLPWSTAQAKLIRAAIAVWRGDSNQAIELLKQAARELDRYDMALFAAAARRQLGRLLGGIPGRDMMFEADANMGEKGIANPEAVANLVAPGFIDLV